MRGRVQCRFMSRVSSLKSVMICLFFLLQIVAPMAIAEESEIPSTIVEQTEQLEGLNDVGIIPSEELIKGWF